MPCSSSRASSGAPTNRPASAGSTASPRTAVDPARRTRLWKCADDQVAARARRRRQAATRARRGGTPRGSAGRVTSAASGERDEQPEPGDELRAGAAATSPMPLQRRASPAACGCRAAARAPCRRAAAPRGRPVDRPGRVDDRAVAAGRAASSWRPLWRSRTISRTPRIVPSGRRGPVRIRCDSSSSSTSPSSRTAPSPSRTMWSQTRSMSAIDVRGDHDRRATSRRRRPSAAAGTRVRRAGRARRTARRAAAARGRFPSASASASRARSPAESAPTFVCDASAREQLGDDRVVPARVRPPRELDRLANGERAVERRALRHVADLREHRGLAQRVAAEHRDRALGRREQARPRARAASTCRRRSGRRARRSRRSGIVSVQSRSAPLATEALAERPRVERRGVHATRRSASPEASRRSARGCSPRRGPAARAAASQRSSSARSASWCRSEGGASVLATNVPRPCRATTRPSRSRSRYAFATVFGLIARSATTSRTVGSWSPTSISPEPERLLHLLHDLEVGRDAGARVEVELDHHPILRLRGAGKMLARRPGPRGCARRARRRRSSTASFAVAFSRSSTGFTSTMSSELDEPRLGDDLHREVRLAIREAAAYRRADARRVLGIDDVHVEAHVHEARPGGVGERLPHAGLDPDAVDLAHREHLRVEPAEQLALARVERADTDESEMRPASTAGSVQPSSANAGPARPSAAASTMPCTFPLGDDSGVLRSPCASIHTTPPGPCAAARPTSVPSAIEWSPPSTSGMRARARALDDELRNASHSSRICGEEARAVVARVVRLGDRRVTSPRSSTATPSFSLRCCFELGVADRRGPHVDAAPILSEIERRADHDDRREAVACSRPQG